MLLGSIVPVYAETPQKAPKIEAKSAIVMDATTGQILYNKSMDAQKYPASLTKLMTVLLTLENCDLNEKVTFSKEAVYGIEPGSSNIGILPGEVLTVEQCLYGMMLESANEVCSAIAEHISGSVDEFAKKMTQRATELGCKNTQFKNANGLHNDEHYTTAYDMALILKELLKYPEFRTVASSRNYKLKKTNKQKARWLGNHHKMIRYPTGSIYSLPSSLTATSGKTAFTTKAKTCLATSATNQEMELICIVMEDSGVDVYWDTKALFEYIFDHYEYIQPLKNYVTTPTKSSNLLIHNLFTLVDPKTLDLHIDKDCIVTVPKNYDQTKLTTSVTYDLNTATHTVGTLHISYNNSEVGTTPIFFSSFTAPPVQKVEAYKDFNWNHFNIKNFHFYMLSTQERIFLFSTSAIAIFLFFFFLRLYVNIRKKRKAISLRYQRSRKQKRRR